MQGINQSYNEIKNLSDQQLVQIMQDPNSILPKYMVLAEIESRKPIRQAFGAANMEQPMTTIADESIQEFMGANPMTTPSDISQAERPGPNPMTMPSDMAQVERLGANPMSPALMRRFQGFASGGLTGYQEGGFMGGLRSLGEFTGVIDEEGKIDPAQAALLGLTFIPGVGLVARGGMGLFKAGKGLASLIKSGAPQAANFLGRQAQKLVSRPGQVQAQATRVNTSQPIGEAARRLGISDDVANVTTRGRQFDPMRAYTTGVAVPAGIASISNIGDAANERDAKEQERLAEILQERNDELNKDKTGGLNDLVSSPNVKSDRRKVSGLELAQLGGIIAGSRDFSELGKGIGALATQTAKDRQASKLAERKLDIDERRVTAMEEGNILKQNQFLAEQLTAQMQVDYPLFLAASDKLGKGKTPSDSEQQAFDRYTKNLATYQQITGTGGMIATNDSFDPSQYITKAS
tara:strand:+ start:1855 stop:3246 length:1392 start_codon:yes stop_codon:yes gene_type:complete